MPARVAISWWSWQCGALTTDTRSADVRRPLSAATTSWDHPGSTVLVDAYARFAMSVEEERPIRFVGRTEFSRARSRRHLSPPTEPPQRPANPAAKLSDAGAPCAGALGIGVSTRRHPNRLSRACGRVGVSTRRHPNRLSRACGRVGVSTRRHPNRPSRACGRVGVSTRRHPNRPSRACGRVGVSTRRHLVLSRRACLRGGVAGLGAR